MAPSWAYAFTAAALLTLAGTPLLRRVALATDFVDHPIAAHKSHQRATPYLGGIALITGVLIALLFTSRLTSLVAVVAIGGSLIGCLGLLDDHRSVGAFFRFAVEMAVAAVAVAVGLRIHATDIPAIDGLITMVWIVGVTNAVNLLDNMDGLAAGVAAAASVAIFALAVLREQFVTATLAAGMAGACIGFLAHNKRPASIFMGDTGSLFLGFVLGVATIGVDPALDPPASFAVPVMLLALPVLDTATVTISRLRRGRSVSQGGKDHLSHRLVARGLSPGGAVGVLVGVEALVGLLAVLAGRQVIPLPAAVLIASAVLATLAVSTARASVYTEPVVGLPAVVKLAAFGGVTVLLLLAGPATIALARAHGPGIAGATATRQGLEALAAGDATRATALFQRASGDLDEAADALDGPLGSLGLLVPGVRANVATARTLVEAGQHVATEASRLPVVVEASTIPLDQASNPADAGRRVAPALADAASVLRRAAGQLLGYDRPYLWPSLRTLVRDVRADLIDASGRAATAAEIARLAPGLLGDDGIRRYFVAVQDNGELRGTGGVLRLWGELIAEDGRLRLAHLGPIDELNRPGGTPSVTVPEDFLRRYRQFGLAATWQNVNVSPDFSATGRVIAELYPQSGGTPVDGVVAVDLPGLAALLELAGPTPVAGLPERVTGANVLDVLARERFEHSAAAQDRHALLAAVARSAAQPFTTGTVGSPARLAAALAPAARGGHLLLYSSRPDERELFERLGAAGHGRPGGGDSLLVVNQNLTGAPVDSHLRRRVHYDVRLDPGASPANVAGRIEVTLANDAPGENRTELSVYTPLGLTTRPPEIETGAEFGRRTYSTTVAIPPQQSRTVRLDVEGRMELGEGNWYHLDVARQPSLVPDETEITLSVPPGWRITGARGGIDVLDARHAVGRWRLADGHQLSVRVERSPWSRLWARIPS